MSGEPHINGASASTGTDGQCSSGMVPAALPDELRTLVDSIARRTRLRRRERTDVSRELTSRCPTCRSRSSTCSDSITSG
jgi:hypothetical protein